MRITERTLRDAVVLELADEFTYGNRKEFSAQVEKSRTSACSHLIVNVRDVTYMDSAAIGLLALTAQQFKGANKTLSLVGPQGTVKQVLDLANISTIIPTFPSEEAAIAGSAA
jgi:anti-anti-sigma factor